MLHSFLRKTVKALTASQSAWLSGADTLATIPETVTKPYAQHPTVYRAVNVISNSISQLTQNIFPLPLKKDQDPIEGHWFPELMAAPSIFERGGQLIEATVASLELKGEAFWWHRDILRGGSDLPLRPHSVWWLSPDSMWPNTDLRTGELVGWRWNSPMGTKEIPLEELTFFRYWNPYDRIRGLSTLSSALLEYTGDHRAALWNRAFFDNSALPAVVFKTKAPRWDQTDRERFIQAYENKHRGATHAGKSLALPGGVDVEILKLTQHEMEFLRGRGYAREQTFGVFGVPPVLGGVFEHANYANSREQQKLFWMNKLIPIITYIQRVINLDFISRYDPLVGLIFDTAPKLAEVMAKDFAEKVGTGQKLWAMGWPAAKINERLQLGMPTEGLEHLEVGFLPMNVVPAEDLLTELEDEEEEPATLPTDEDDEEGDEEEEEETINLPAATTIRAREDRRRSRSRALARQRQGIARAAGRKFRNTLFLARKQVFTAIDKAVAAEKGLQKAINPDDLIFNLKAVQGRFKRIGRAAWLKAVDTGGTGVIAEAGVAGTIAFDVSDSAVQAFLASKEVQIISVPTRILAKVNKKVTAVIDAGLTEATSIEILAANLKAEVGSVFAVERARATVWARTESHQAFALGRHAGMKQAGIQEKEWLTSRDGKVRDHHAELDGQKVAVDETFSNGLLHPGDITGPPEEIIQCRCDEIPAGSAE